MKKSKLVCCISLLHLLIVCNMLFAQPMPYDAKYVDSATKRLKSAAEDTSKVNSLTKLAAMYLLINPALTIKFAKEGAAIAEKIHYPQGEINCLGQSAFCFALGGEWAKATNDVNVAIPLCEKYNPRNLIYMYNIMFIVSATKEDKEQALKWAQMAFHVPAFSALNEIDKWATYMQLGLSYDFLDRMDSAKYYSAILLNYVKKYGGVIPDLRNNSFMLLGNIAFKDKNYQQALQYYRSAANSPGLAKVYQMLNQPDSAIYYGLLALKTGQVQKTPFLVMEASKLLADLYGKSDPLKSNAYLNMYVASKDSLFATDKLKQLEELNLKEQKNIFELQIKETFNRNRFIRSVLFVIMTCLTIFIFFIWRNNRFKQKANLKLDAAFNNLKNTQARLIQSEKMASLGELTAGIAHEIQNPLNFVNNFSEVSNELIDEMNAELDKGDIEEAKLIAVDVKQNLEKINHHGKRAGDIVKGMLQHSRNTSNATKEPTDINKLADEYLRLAYHGLRAKDKSFNAIMKTDFDKTIGNINIIPQDIGRVILNLITNAFYAVDEKKKSGIGERYEPTVLVSTKKSGDKILITVKDNGNGIPQKIIDKIFQPFFTTKPTGQGTGLGLSLSYDIVKAHGGELKVETKEGQGTTFTIQLPIV